jgi:RNA polymerase sigma factor (sigma-70 family)
VVKVNAEGWPAHLGAVLERARPQLARLLKAYRIPALDAEDLMQDALLGLVANWPEVREPAAYLAGTMRHLCRNYVRQQLRHKGRIAPVDPAQLELLAGAAPSGQEERDALADVARLAQTLGPRPRRLLWLAVVQGFDDQELARILGGAKPASLLRARRRALKRLRELLRRS